MNTEESPKERLQRRKLELEEQELVRQARSRTRDEAVGWWTTKAAGAGLTTVGTLEWLFPEVIAAVVLDPLTFGGAGLALLAGRKAAKQVVAALGELLK
jgi:hypothetical protein